MQCTFFITVFYLVFAAIELELEKDRLKMVHSFNLITWETEASLINRASSRTAKATGRNPVSGKKQKTNKKNQAGQW